MQRAIAVTIARLASRLDYQIPVTLVVFRHHGLFSVSYFPHNEVDPSVNRIRGEKDWQGHPCTRAIYGMRSYYGVYAIDSAIYNNPHPSANADEAILKAVLHYEFCGPDFYNDYNAHDTYYIESFETLSLADAVRFARTGRVHEAVARAIGAMHADLLDEIRQPGTRRSRFNNVLSMGQSARDERAYRLGVTIPRSDNRRIEYKGEAYYVTTSTRPDWSSASSLRRWRNHRKVMRMLGEAVAKGDTGEVADILVDNPTIFAQYGMSWRRKMLRKIQNHCDVDVENCDCGHFEHSGNDHSVRSDTWCEQCFNDDAVWVEDLEEYWPRDGAYWSDNHDAYYSYDRDEEEREDDDDDDDDDDEAEDPNNLMSYGTNVLNVLNADSSIQSSQFGEFLMGIELEMTSGSDSVSDAIDDVRGNLGTDYCIAKSDGSLPSNGFEIVTAPRGLAEHIKRFGDWPIHSTYRAWDTGSCGLHVHIDSHAFSAMTLGKFLMFINSDANHDFIRKIAGRHPKSDSQAGRYCAAEGQQTLETPAKAIKGKPYGERYRMVNTQNLRPGEATRLGLSDPMAYGGKYNTIELRIFRASLKKERLLAQIEFTHACVMFCRATSYRDLNGTSFIKWLRTMDGVYPALIKWYGVRPARTNATAPAEATCADQP